MTCSTSFPNRSYCEESCGQTSKFCCKNGWQFEHVTRQKNPGETPFKYVHFCIIFWLIMLCAYVYECILFVPFCFPFWFLCFVYLILWSPGSFSTSCSDYKYYEYPLAEEEKALLRNKDSQSGIIVFLLPWS